MRWQLGLILALTTGAFGEDSKALLADADPARRLRAAEALARSGAAAAVPELAECLVDEDASLRAAAARALGSAGPAAKGALPALERLFDDPETAVRTEAYAAVIRVGAVGSVADAVCRDRAVLGLFGAEHRDVLRALLGAESWHVRLWVLQHDLVRKQAPDAWAEQLGTLAAGDPAQVVRFHAVGALAWMRQPAAIPQLVNRFADRDARIRAAAVYGVGLQMPEDAGVVRAVEGRLADPVPQIRAWACYALRGHKASAPNIRPLLLANDPELPVVAGAVLGAMGIWPDLAAEALVAAALHANGLEAPYPVEGRFRRNLRAGGGSGWRTASEQYPPIDSLALDVVLASGEQAVPHLEREYRRATEADRKEAVVFVLARLRAAGSLQPVLTDASPDLRRHAAASRAWLGEKDDTTIAILVGCLDGPAEIEETEVVIGVVDWAATPDPLLEKIGAAALPALKARLAVIAGDRVPDAERTDARALEATRIRDLMRRIAEK